MSSEIGGPPPLAPNWKSELCGEKIEVVAQCRGIFHECLALCSGWLELMSWEWMPTRQLVAEKRTWRSSLIEVCLAVVVVWDVRGSLLDHGWEYLPGSWRHPLKLVFLVGALLRSVPYMVTWKILFSMLYKNVICLQ